MLFLREGGGHVTLEGGAGRLALESPPPPSSFVALGYSDDRAAASTVVSAVAPATVRTGTR